LFLEHGQNPVPGSATICILEGTRPLLVEVQALVLKSQLAMPRRVGRGIELSRIQVLSAVLQKHCNLPLSYSDIFLSAAGGFKVREPAVDLGLAVAVASSLKNKAIPKKTIFIGEVGLLGEIRSVQYLDRRIKEAKRLGFSQVISRKSHSNVREVLKELKLTSP
ncbi:MAG: magnesium chelatase domain-containing protein, partial [Patescibacteria group bacterium]